MNEAEALDRLRRILAQPAFVTADTRTLWERVVDALRDLLYDLLARLWSPAEEAVTSGRNPWTVALLVLCLLALAVVAGLLVRAIRRRMGGEGGTREAAAARRARSDRLWQEGQALAAQGRYTEAIRALYLSALLALDEHGVLHVEEGRTNREHALAIAGSRAAAGGSFVTLVERYDRLRYAGVPVDAEACAAIAALAEQTRGAA